VSSMLRGPTKTHCALWISSQLVTATALHAVKCRVRFPGDLPFLHS